jgi:ABC-type branched-subunit amino acid transport system permease subunit
MMSLLDDSISMGADFSAFKGTILAVSSMFYGIAGYTPLIAVKCIEYVILRGIVYYSLESFWSWD